MSKVVDMSQPLSEEDVLYLQNRGQGYLVTQAAELLAAAGPELPFDATADDLLAVQENTGDTTVKLAVSESEYSRADYESWKVDDLREEINDRNTARKEADPDNADIELLDSSGKKAELIDVLVAADLAEVGQHRAEDETEDDTSVQE